MVVVISDSKRSEAQSQVKEILIYYEYRLMHTRTGYWPAVVEQYLLWPINKIKDN